MGAVDNAWLDGGTGDVSRVDSVDDPFVSGGGCPPTSLFSELNSVDGFDGPVFGRGECAPRNWLSGWNHVGYTGLDNGASIPANKWSDPVDGPGFGAGAFIPLVDARPGSDGAELDDAWPGSGAELDGPCTADASFGTTNQFSMYLPPTSSISPHFSPRFSNAVTVYSGTMSAISVDA